MYDTINPEGLTPGFTDHVFESQQVFRKLLNAMSYPGRIEKFSGILKAPYPLHIASGAICLSLLDYETPLWSDLDPDSDPIAWIRFHTGCPIVEEPLKACFAFITNIDKMPPLNQFALGTAENPELSTTLILQLDGFASDKSIELGGPGIKTSTLINLKGISDQFFRQRSEFHCFPLGLDIIFTYQDSLLAIPRSIRMAKSR